MRVHHRVRYAGRCLHVDLPDVMPPDWDAVRRDLDPDLLVFKAYITAPRTMTADDEAALDDLRRDLALHGVTVAVYRPTDFPEQYFG